MERLLIPEGRQTVEVHACQIRDVHWKVSDENPTGECLTFQLKQGESAFIWADIPTNWNKLRSIVSSAIGAALDDPGALVGLTCEIEVVHRETQKGMRAYVHRWVTEPAKRKSELQERFEQQSKLRARVAKTVKDARKHLDQVKRNNRKTDDTSLF